MRRSRGGELTSSTTYPSGGPLVGHLVPTSYQCPRTMGCVPRVTTFDPSCQGKDSPDLMRQHDSGDINKEGGTGCPSFSWETLKRLRWCGERDIRLVASHVPGVDNVLADALSREDSATVLFPPSPPWGGG